MKSFRRAVSLNSGISIPDDDFEVTPLDSSHDDEDLLFKIRTPRRQTYFKRRDTRLKHDRAIQRATA